MGNNGRITAGHERAGPLLGMRVVELGGIGPGPFAAMLLADLGADVVRIDRPGSAPSNPPERSAQVLHRGRRFLEIDLKTPSGIAQVLDMVEVADVLMEGFRPGVTERLGVGPAECWSRNAGLVYGRVTGWGQTGPLSQTAGHDLNYIALSGALDAIGHPSEPPVPPVNFLGDYGSGAMLLAFGVMCALREAQVSGLGQVVDAAMVDGAALFLNSIMGKRSIGRWNDTRGTNAIDGGAHFYNVYECSDGRHITIAAVEPQFYEGFLAVLGLRGPEWHPQMAEERWPTLTLKLRAIFRRKTRDEWSRVFQNVDVCFAPVRTAADAADHSHNADRELFVRVDGVLQASPAPRFSRTPGSISGGVAPAVDDAARVLHEWHLEARHPETG